MLNPKYKQWLCDALDQPPFPAGIYKPVVVRNGIGCVSGQFPIHKGKLVFQGCVGKDLSLEEGRDAAVLAAINCVAQIRHYQPQISTNGFELLRLDGMVASAPDFFAQPEVLDAASETLIDLLGNSGMHTRTALAVPQLPLNSAIELVVMFSLSTSYVDAAKTAS